MISTSELGKLNVSTGSATINQRQLYWSAPGWIAGIPQGGVIEIRGSQSAEWFIEFLKMNPDLGVFWADRKHQAISLRRVMQSQMFEVLLAPNKYSDIKTLQALQIFAEKSNTALFLFSVDNRIANLPISLQLEITKHENGHFRVYSLGPKKILESVEL